MGNQYLSQELYNEDLKNKFLNEFKSSIKKDAKTLIFYRYVFQISYATENQLKKDIYDFNDVELYALIKSYKNGSVSAVQSIASVIKRYLDFCVRKGYVNANLLQDTSGYEDYLQFVDKTVQKNKFITRKELRDMLEHCENYQDAVCPALAFYGFKGEDCLEMVNLKIKHVNITNNTIYIESRDKTYEVDDFLMEILIGAIDEKEYHKSNGDEEVSMKAKTYKIYDTDYVVRPSARDTGTSINPDNITPRLNRVKKYWGNPYLTITSIWYSGMLDIAKNIIEENGTIEKNDWINILEKFGHPVIHWSKIRQRLTPALESLTTKV